MDEQPGRRLEPPPALPKPESPALLPPPAPRRSRRGWLILLVVLLAVGGLAYWLHPFSAGRRGPPAAPPQAVRTAQVATGNIPINLNGLGTVTPLATVTVKTQINGQLQTFGFQEGQLVKKGDFLAQIDPRPYQVALEQAQGTLAHDQGLLAMARADFARYQTLNRQDSISRQQVEDQQFLVQQYQGTVAADQGQVDNAKLNLAYCHIVSPVDGRVGLRQVDPGNYVQTSDANGLVVITQLQPISVIFTLPEDDIPQITKRLQAGATLPVTATDRSNTTKLATGTLATLDNVVDTTTGTVKLRASFDNADNALFPSQFVNVALLVDTVSNALVVPTQAVQQGAPGSYVYVVNANNTVSVRTVKTGPSDGTNTSITSGLTAGEQVVIDGADRLSDGSKVTVNNTTPGAPAATPTTPQAGRRRRRQGSGSGSGQGSPGAASSSSAPQPAAQPPSSSQPQPQPAPAQ